MSKRKVCERPVFGSFGSASPIQQSSNLLIYSCLFAAPILSTTNQFKFAAVVFILFVGLCSNMRMLDGLLLRSSPCQTVWRDVLHSYWTTAFLETRKDGKGAGRETCDTNTINDRLGGGEIDAYRKCLMMPGKGHQQVIYLFLNYIFRIYSLFIVYIINFIHKKWIGWNSDYICLDVSLVYLKVVDRLYGSLQNLLCLALSLNSVTFQHDHEIDYIKTIS